MFKNPVPMLTFEGSSSNKTIARDGEETPGQLLERCLYAVSVKYKHAGPLTCRPWDDYRSRFGDSNRAVPSPLADVNPGAGDDENTRLMVICAENISPERAQTMGGEAVARCRAIAAASFDERTFIDSMMVVSLPS